MELEALFSTPQSIAAQCVGLVAMLLAFFIYALRTRKRILLAKLLADALWVAHYLLLGAYSGALVNAVNAAREGVFYHKERAWAKSLAWPVGFILVNGCLIALTWQGAISLLPLLGSACNTVGLWCSDTRTLRLISIPSLSLWLLYSVCVGSVWSLAVNAVSLVSVVYALIRDERERKDA